MGVHLQDLFHQLEEPVVWLVLVLSEQVVALECLYLIQLLFVVKIQALVAQ